MAFELKNYQFSLGEHKGKSVIWVQFPNNDTLREELKLAFPTAKFSWTQKCWYLSDIAAIRRQLELDTKHKAPFCTSPRLTQNPC